MGHQPGSLLLKRTFANLLEEIKDSFERDLLEAERAVASPAAKNRKGHGVRRALDSQLASALLVMTSAAKATRFHCRFGTAQAVP